jgi:hypothetical protein
MQIISSLALFFILNPYLGLPSVFPSDIQPFSLLFCIPFVRIRSGYAQIVFCSLLFFAFLAICLGCISLAANVYSLSLIDIFRSIFPFAAPPLYFSAGITLLQMKSTYVHFRRLVACFIILYLFGALLNLTGLTTLIQLFVQRSVFVQFGSRGLTSFFPEPSRISEQVLLITFLITYLAVRVPNILKVPLFFITVLAGSGQTLIVYLQLFAAWILSSWRETFIRAFSFIRLNRVRPSSFLSSITFLLFILIFIASNTSTRGFKAFSNILASGLSYVASDLGIQIKLSGLIAFFASVFEFSPFWHFPLLSYETRPDFIFFYSAFFSSLFDVNKPPYVDNIYSSFGQYSISFGFLGILLTIMLIVFPYLSGRECFANRRPSTFWFLYLLMLLFSFLKVPASNPATWIMLSAFFVKKKMSMGTSCLDN